MTQHEGKYEYFLKLLTQEGKAYDGILGASPFFFSKEVKI
jgi:hypothetical protein